MVSGYIFCLRNAAKFALSACLVAGALLGAAALAQNAQVAPLRPPATPLILHDPYFSVWSMADAVTGDRTRHWTGVPQQINGIVRVDGHNYRFLGKPGGAEIPALKTVSQQVTPTRTIAVMTSPEIKLEMTFLNPAFPDDLAEMARPVTYLTWKVSSRDGREHDVTLYLDASGNLATNDPGEQVEWSRGKLAGLDLLRIGTKDQAMLQRYGDNVRIDWGWFYLAVPTGQGKAESGAVNRNGREVAVPTGRDSVELLAGNRDDRAVFLKTGSLPAGDDLDMPRAPMSRYPSPPTLSVALPLGQVGQTAVSRHVLLAYDERFPIEYMHRMLRPYWSTQFQTFGAMLEAAARDYPALEAKSRSFDAELERDLVSVGGPKYAAIAVLAYGQAIAAHKLVEDENGVPFFMPKENFSNGSISTVDVIFPSAPEFLLLNPRLAQAQLEPVLRYAESSRWKFPFAPHDLGVYPLANGQQYGGGENSEVNQMPVEESGNVLILVDAISRAEGNADFARRYWPLLTKWAEYLMANGMDPKNQLSTDDFAGHLAHNANLSIKAIEALGAYAQVARQLGKTDTADRYQRAARQMAQQWTKVASDGDHYRLAFDRPGTWSQKYNLVWDTILGLNLFPPNVRATMISFYLKHLNRYGLPLDNRHTYTKLDWTIWTATMAGNRQDFEKLVDPVYLFLNETPDRVPMSDWYDTVSGKKVGFQARSVVGGVFIKMLADPAMWTKWSSRAKAPAVSRGSD